MKVSKVNFCFKEIWRNVFLSCNEKKSLYCISKMTHPDQKYVEALINNDTLLLEELYQKYSGKIKWMVLQNNGSEAEAADIFQEALLAIYKKTIANSFVLTCPLEAFLYLICKNKWMNELSKKKSSRVTIQDTDVYNIGEDAFKEAEVYKVEQDRKELLIQKVAELCESCRQLLDLSWTGKPMDEVAKILNVTYGYVRKKKCECMAKLVNLVKQSDQYNSMKW